MRLLVSVRNRDEARAALAGGCDILDVKEPERGPLAMADPAVLAEIVQSVRTTTATPLSAALGELTDWSDNAAVPALPPGLDFVKLGLSEVAGWTDWPERWAEVRRRFEAASKATFSWVAVAYADWQLAASPRPEAITAEARRTGCRILLVDTFTKDGRSLLDFLSSGELQSLSHVTREAGLQLALAGSLRADLIPQLAMVAPEIVAIRSAACTGGTRGAAVSHAAVARFRAALSRMPSADACSGPDQRN